VADRLERLRQLWMVSQAASADIGDSSQLGGAWRHAYNWMRVLQTRVLGAPGHFTPRYLSPSSPYTSFYDLAPLRERLLKLVEFDRLNGGEVRFSVATTDIATGETVTFDTAKGDRITVDHLLASAGYLPEFSPLEIDGRLLGDGGLSINAPVEAVLLEDDLHENERVCFVVDLFARDGERPTGLESAIARKNDLLFGNQTWKRLELHQRVLALDAELAAMTERVPAAAGEAIAALASRRSHTRAIYYLSYRAPPEEAGPEKIFDLSSATAQDRWRAGELDMAEALRQLRENPLPARGCALQSIRREP
jgi:NTE family protein